MPSAKISKVVSALPSTLEDNTIYLVRIGQGFDIIVTNSDGTVSYTQNKQTHFPSIINKSGRMYCYNDERWITNSDDNYGTTYYQFAESGGIGEDPDMEWEHKGEYVRQGTILHEIAMVARLTDIASIEDIEVIVAYTNPLGRWTGVGLDNDNEDEHTVLYRGFLGAGGGLLPPVTTPLNDERLRVIPLGDFVVPANGDVRLYMRPKNVLVRPNTSTDYVQMMFSWAFSVPSFISS